MKVVIPLLALAAFAPAQEIVIHNQSSNGHKDELAYNRRNEITFTGKVSGKLKSYAVGTGRSVPVRILVKSNGGTATVDLGPTWYLKDQSTTIDVGDTITVTGSKFKINGQYVINARQVRKRGALLVLRDSGGFPYWVAHRQAAPVEPASGAVAGRIARMQTINIGGQMFNGAVITTPDGERLVAFAPDWYYSRQDIGLAPGTYIRTYGGVYDGAFSVGGGIQSPAPGLYVVNSLYTPNGYFGFTNPTGYVYGNFPGFPGVFR